MTRMNYFDERPVAGMGKLQQALYDLLDCLDPDHLLWAVVVMTLSMTMLLHHNGCSADRVRERCLEHHSVAQCEAL